MSFAVDNFLELLIDGDWHSLEELGKHLGLEKSAVLEIADFWSRYAFVELDLENEKVKLNPDTQKLLALAEAAEIPSPPTVEEPAALVIEGVIKSVEPVGKTELKISGEKLKVNWGPKLEALETPQEIVPVRVLRNGSRQVRMLLGCLDITLLLGDGCWHDYEELSERFSLSLDDVITIVRLMDKHGYVTVAEKWGKVKMRIALTTLHPIRDPLRGVSRYYEP